MIHRSWMISTGGTFSFECRFAFRDETVEEYFILFMTYELDKKKDAAKEEARRMGFWRALRDRLSPDSKLRKMQVLIIDDFNRLYDELGFALDLEEEF